MPYIILNDRVCPPHYYIGAGFRIGVNTAVNADAAETFPTVQEALAVMKDPDAAYRYANGWRIVPLNRKKA